MTSSPSSSQGTHLDNFGIHATVCSRCPTNHAGTAPEHVSASETTCELVRAVLHRGGWVEAIPLALWDVVLVVRGFSAPPHTVQIRLSIGIGVGIGIGIGIGIDIGVGIGIGICFGGQVVFKVEAVSHSPCVNCWGDDLVFVQQKGTTRAAVEAATVLGDVANGVVCRQQLARREWRANTRVKFAAW